MRMSAILPFAAALIVAAAMSMPSGAKTISKTKAAKCSQVYDSCATSPLCHSSNQAIREQCRGRCLNRQAKCLGIPIFSGANATKEGKGGTKGRVPVTRPTVRQPTTTVGTKTGSPIVRPTVQQPTETRGTSSGPIRGGRPSQNRK
jgi:hypothetical protein